MLSSSLNFLGWVLAQGEIVQTMIEHLLAGGSGLRDETGNDYFAGRFHHLPRTGAAVYADLCETVFHGRGRLHVVYLTAGEGELHLRTAANAPFGVVNVGDSAALYKLLSETDAGNFEVDREMGFAERLFSAVDRADSSGKRGDRCPALHRRLELLAREYDGADARRRRRRSGDYPDVWGVVYGSRAGT